MSHLIPDAEAAFKASDVEKLRKISLDPECNFLTANEFSRINQLLGDLYRRKKNFRGAKVAYIRAHMPPEFINVSSLYGLAECSAAVKNRDEFGVVLEEFLTYSHTVNPNFYSRLMVAAAKLDLAEKVDQLVNEIGDAEPDDARYWLRRAQAERLLGRDDRIDAPLENAKKLAADDKDLLVEIAMLDYNVSEYWELRYNSSEGERTPVLRSQQDDIAYKACLKRDTDYLRNKFKDLFGDDSFEKVAECGCGSGRLIPFLHERMLNIDCYDISKTAIEFAKKNTEGLANLEFTLANLVEDPLPSKAYDLVFDFTVVQHVSNKDEWSRVLANYVQACKPGGYIFLLEFVGNDKESNIYHVRNASAESYKSEILKHDSYKFKFEEKTPWNHQCMVFQRDSE